MGIGIAVGGIGLFKSVRRHTLDFQKSLDAKSRNGSSTLFKGLMKAGRWVIGHTYTPPADENGRRGDDCYGKNVVIL